MVSTVLFASVRNAGRTQMAAAWFNALAHPDKARAVSAGTDPAEAVYPQVLEVMRDVGLDLSSREPTVLTPPLTSSADLIIVIGPPSPEPLVEGAGEREEWLVVDPLGEPKERIRDVARDIERLVRRLLVARHWMPFGASTPP